MSLCVKWKGNWIFRGFIFERFKWEISSVARVMRSFPSMRKAVRSYRWNINYLPQHSSKSFPSKWHHKDKSVNNGKSQHSITTFMAFRVKRGKTENNYQRPLLLSENSDFSSFTEYHSEESRFWNLNCCIISITTLLLRQLSRPPSTF